MPTSELAATGQARWEYRDFVMSWPPGQRWWVVIDEKGPYPTEASARLRLWDDPQREVLVEYQKWLDQGWEPVTEIGPSALQLEYFRNYFGGWVNKIITVLLIMSVFLTIVGLIWLFVSMEQAVKVVEVRVTTRRRID